jgi:hypothetical protein
MPNLLRGVLLLLCLKLLFASMSLKESSDHKCALGECITYGGPNERYSIGLLSPERDFRSGGWIVGEIRAFAFGGDNPALVRSLARNGWVECAGQQIDVQDFPEAVAVLQDTWGSQDISKTRVYLPDLRGLVLRGWHHGRRASEKYPFSPYTGDTDLESRVFPRPELRDGPEPGIAGPTDFKTGRVTKDHVGSMQPEQFHGHRHSLSYIVGNGVVHVSKDDASRARSAGEPVRFGGSTDFTGGNETHPPNVYVFYLIYLGRSVNVKESQPLAPLETYPQLGTSAELVTQPR